MVSVRSGTAYTTLAMRWERYDSRQLLSGGKSTSSTVWVEIPLRNFSDSIARPTTPAWSQSIPNLWRLWSERNGTAIGAATCPKS